MNTTSKRLALAIVAVVVVGLAATGIYLILSSDRNVSGRNNNTPESFDAGIEVNNTEVVNSAGQWVGGLLSALSSAFSGTVSTTGAFVPNSIGSGINIETAGTATTSPTSANLCHKTISQWAPVNAVSTSTLPDAVPFIAECLAAAGGHRRILWENTSGAASTTSFSPGASSTIEYASSTGARAPLSGGDGAYIDFWYSTSTTGSSDMMKIKISPFND